MKTCKMLYAVSYKPELWHDILMSQFQPRHVLAVINETHKETHIATGIDYILEDDIINEYIPLYSDEVTNEDENDLFEVFTDTGTTSLIQNEITASDLSKIKPDNLRQIALTLYQLACRQCKQIKIDVFYCPILEKNMCLACLKQDKYKMLSIGSAKGKFKISQEELDKLGVKYVEATNPINYGFKSMKLYYEIQLRQALEYYKIPAYQRLKALEETLIDKGYKDAFNYIYGKMVENYIKGRSDDLNRCVVFIINRYDKTKEKEKKPKKKRTKRA